jgi:cytidylate kinase
MERGIVMRIIAISREFGSGGRELGKRLADKLGYDYYDSEIISAVAKNSGMDAGYVETALSDHGWQDFPITYRSTIGSSVYLNSGMVNLLLEQKRVIEGIAELGKDFVIVGRNADVILQQYEPFSLFVCADLQTKVQRCRERAPEGENLSEKELIRKIRQIDKARAKTREILSGATWGQREAYHLTVNTTGWDMKELVTAVAIFAESWFGRTT